MPLLWNASKSKLPETLVRPVATGQIGKAAEKHSKTAPSIEPNENMPVLSDYVQTYAPNPATDSPASDSKRRGTLPMVSIISVLCTFAILSWALLRKRYKSHRTSENNP